jgi:hypothetical protein
MFISCVMLAMAAVEAEAAVQTRPILNSTEYVYSHSTKSIPLYLGTPVRVISLKIQASAPTRRDVNTDISVAGVSVGTIMLPGRNPDPTFSAGGSGTELTSSIELTSQGGTVAIRQIYVTYEVPEVVAIRVEPNLPWDTFIVQTQSLRSLERSSLPAYYGDLAVAVVDSMLAFVSPVEWQTNLFPIKWKASELRNLAKAYGPSNRDVVASMDGVIAAIDAKVDFLMEKSLTPVTWPYVTDLISIREKLASLTGNSLRLPVPANIGESRPR